MSTDSIVNRGDYLSAYYLAEVLPRDVKKPGGLRDRWAEREKNGEPVPAKALRGLRDDYHAARLAHRNASDDQDLQAKITSQRNAYWLRALGYSPSHAELEVTRAGEPHPVQVAYAGQGVVALDCAWVTEVDAAFDPSQGARLLAPAEVDDHRVIETGAKLAEWLFAADDPPRYVLLLHGGVIVLADRITWGEGRYLAVSLDAAFDAADAADLELIAALFGADSLQPPAEGGTEALAGFVEGSRDHTVGVSAELREGLRESVQILANEVLARLDAQKVPLTDIAESHAALAKDLGRQSLRFLYRILFLLFAEARPELGILPVDDEDYIAGYSMARLGDIVTRRLGGPEAVSGFHLYESLAVLFRMVNEGHAAEGDQEGIAFEALKADLFDPKRTRLIGSVQPLGYAKDEPGVPEYDTRPRDGALYEVLRRLMIARAGGSKGGGRGGGRKKAGRGGFISYAQLGIPQLGAVYEGLMSYTGFIADEELLEVAKDGDPSGGSWMIPRSQEDSYDDGLFVKERDENGFRTAERVRYRPGSFVYRLAGRDREVSASYYTPQTLTKVTVQLTLEQKIKEQEAASGGEVTADDVLHWRVCEPALGSGTFLNEAIDQLADLYLRLREKEPGGKLEPEARALALQKVKAYIALHNCYGVDLNETAVELAEVSIWLNVMHKGLQAPWFGLHLVRGNSLIGAGRRIYPPSSLVLEKPRKKGAKQNGEKRSTKPKWLDTAPLEHPFSAGDLPAGHVHHFLLPALGWGAVAGEREAKQLGPDDAKRLGDWRAQIRKAPSLKKGGADKPSQVERLQALSRRAEYLWFLVMERLRISEREIRRPIDVWKATNLPKATSGLSRDEILDDLTAPGTPFWRLKLVMDIWCALWFWPLDQAALLDGSDSELYPLAKPGTAAEPEPVAPREPAPPLPPGWEKPEALFSMGSEQLPLPPQLRPAPSKSSQRWSRKGPTIAELERRSPVPLANMEDWLEFLEAVLGRKDVSGLAKPYEKLEELEEHEEELEDEAHMAQDSFLRIPERFPWVKTAEDIAKAQGFFHWELRFASVFKDGGFDLQVGNPPWVRPRWEENPVLAELEPWFETQEEPDATERKQRKSDLLALPSSRDFYLDEMTEQRGTRDFFTNAATYGLLAGTQPDLYRAFMIRTWRNLGPVGTVGLLHPDTHFVGEAERPLRTEAYRRLRVHGDFVNSGNRFFPPPVNRSSHFGMHIYGQPQEIRFAHLGWLLSAKELPDSLALAEANKLSEHWNADSGVPGVKYKGDWDAREHPDRVVWVDREMLSGWRLVSGTENWGVEESKLLNLVTVKEQDAIVALGKIQRRLGDLHPRISRGYDEKGAKDVGLIRKNKPHDPEAWSDVIFRGPQIGVATPFFKQPPETGTKGRPQDLTILPAAALPRTEYVRATDPDTYRADQDRWIDHHELDRLLASPDEVALARAEIGIVRDIPEPRVTDEQVEAFLSEKARRPYTDFYRLMWREMIPDDTDRSLFPAIYPPGPAHVHGVRSLTMATNRATVLVAGFWTGLPIDYLLRVTRTEHFDVANVRKMMPALDSGHPLAVPLLLRTLRLNCLTAAYADLWAELYEDAWRDEQWAVGWPGIAPLGNVGLEWEYATPLRTEFERRAALVEIDALVAVWLGITQEQLEAIYPARYPILGDYENATWFDATGRKLAGNWNTFGTGQTKEHWTQFQLYWESHPEDAESGLSDTDMPHPESQREPVEPQPTVPPPDGYTAPFYQANRVAEYRKAHAAFTARLGG